MRPVTRDLVTHRASVTPERTALIDAGRDRSMSYRALDGLVDGVAARLGSGGPVGALLGTRVAFVVLVHAAMRQGRPLVPLNTEQPAETLAEQVDRAGVTTLVCGRDTEAAARSAAPAGVEVASVDAPAGDIGSVQPDGGNGGVTPARLSADDTAVVVFTSGTTGTPKGVRLTVGNLVASAVASALRLGVAPGDRWLCCLPMYHVGGLAPAVRTALYGTTLVVRRGFDTGATAAVVRAHDVTGVSLVPTMLRRLLAVDREPAGLSAVLLGGAPADETLLARARDRGVPVYPTYGTTETASQIATATPTQAADHPGTVGQPLLFTDVSVVADGTVRSAGERGELVVDGPTVTPGYLDDGRTAATLSEHGLHTGDLGYRDEAGRLWVTGRLDDAITTGGETVHPATVRAALTDHPDVTDAAVVGVADPEWGERVAALIVGDVDPAAVRAVCADAVPGYAVPRTVAVAEELPRTPSGTVDREAVRERLTAPD